VLSAVTINNYGGSCGYRIPPELARFATEADPPRPAARMLGRINELQEFNDGAANPYLHLVDGGISDNLGLRSVLDLVQSLEALHEAGIPTPLDHVRRIVVIVVNSLSEPTTDWNKREEPPGLLDTLIQASGVPIDRYSGELVEQLKDIAARWKMLRLIRDSAVFTNNAGAAAKYVNNAPLADLFAVDVSFPALKDKAEREYLNQLPTSFVLSDEAVDRLRAAAATIILNSPDFQGLLKSTGAHVVPPLPAKTSDPAPR
jgi:NTE family protein